MSECENVDFKEANVFLLDENSCNFNDVAHKENNFTYWYALDYMDMLGYESKISFKEIIDKAWDVCVAIKVKPKVDLKSVKREFEGKEVNDFKLSRFSCYLISMLSDIDIGYVSESQDFFSEIYSSIKKYIDDPDDVERVFLRALLTEYENSLFKAISQAGLNSDSCIPIQNSGCHGMYKMDVNALKYYRKIKGNGRQYDFMSRYELQLNCSRIEDTLSEIKTKGLKTEDEIAMAAQIAGLKYRNQFRNEVEGKWDIEKLGQVGDIKKIITSLTQTYKEMQKMDS